MPSFRRPWQALPERPTLRAGPRARPRLEALESRLLLSADDPWDVLRAVDAIGLTRPGAVLIGLPPIAPWLEPIAEPEAGRAATPDAGPFVGPATRPSADLAQDETPPDDAIPIGPLPPPPRWVIDRIARLVGQPRPAAPNPRLIDEARAPHESMADAQALPEAQDLLVRGTIGPDSPEDVYRVALSSGMDRVTINLGDASSLAAFVKSVELRDEAGRLYGDLPFGGTGSLSIAIHPTSPNSEHAIYLKITGRPGTFTPPGVDDVYAVAISQHIASNAPFPGSPPPDAPVDSSPGPGRGGSDLTGTLLGGNIALSGEGTTPASSADPAASDAPTGGVTVGVGVGNPGASTALPTRTAGADAGILSLGEAAQAFVPDGLAVDLALLGLDAIALLPDAEGGEPGPMAVGPAASPIVALPVGRTPRPDFGPMIAFVPAMTARTDVAVAAAAAPKAPAVESGAPTWRRRGGWGLFHAGTGIAAALAFVLFMPDAALSFQGAAASSGPFAARPSPFRETDEDGLDAGR